MKYSTKNELANFDFHEAYIGEVQVTSGMFHLTLGNVKIMPENSCNRDIRIMRTNELVLTIENAVLEQVIEEGYKVFDADGNLCETYTDQEMSEEEKYTTVKSFEEGSLYQIRKEGDTYIFEVDAPNEQTYKMVVKGTEDTEEWDRFLTLY